MNNWNKVALSEICDLIAGFAFKSKDFGDYDSKVIKITHITPPSVDMDNLGGVDISKYNAAKLEKFIAKAGDYVLAMTGATIGKIGRIEHGSAYINQRVLLFRPRQNVDKEFLYYALQQYEFGQYITSHADSESAQPNISAGTIGKYQIILPPMEIQKRIGTLLRAYDEKRENNRKINDNLLEQALTLYATQFSSLELNGCIGDYCSVKSGFAFKSSWWTNCGVRVIKIGSINQDNLNLLECSYVDEAKANKAKDFVVKAGDLLIAMTGATIGKFAMVPYSSEVLLVNQRVGKFFLGNNPVEKLPFIYCTLKQPEVYGEVVNRGQGSAQPNISASDIMSIPCGIPNQDAINDFNDMSRPLFDLIISNQRENWQLSELRNALLPKLMSGELDVSDIEL